MHGLDFSKVTGAPQEEKPFPKIGPSADLLRSLPSTTAYRPRITWMLEEERVKVKRAIHHKCDGKCYHCNNELCLEESTLDHLLPVEKGGTHMPSNLVIACFCCNRDPENRFIQPLEC